MVSTTLLFKKALTLFFILASTFTLTPATGNKEQNVDYTMSINVSELPDTPIVILYISYPDNTTFKTGSDGDFDCDSTFTDQGDRVLVMCDTGLDPNISGSGTLANLTFSTSELESVSFNIEDPDDGTEDTHSVSGATYTIVSSSSPSNNDDNNQTLPDTKLISVINNKLVIVGLVLILFALLIMIINITSTLFSKFKNWNLFEKVSEPSKNDHQNNKKDNMKNKI